MDPLAGIIIGATLAFTGFVLMLLSIVLDWADDENGREAVEWWACVILAAVLLIAVSAWL